MAHLDKKTDKWIARVRVGNGKKSIAKSFSNKESALAHEYRLKTSESPVPTIRAFFEKNIPLLYAESTKHESIIRRLLKHIDGDMLITRLDQKAANRLKISLEDAGYMTSTVNNTAAMFNRTISRAFDMGVINTRPLIHYNAPRNQKNRFLNEDEQARLLSNLTEADAATVMFLIYSGVRWSEYARLRPSDYHNGALHILKSKNGKPRTIPLSQTAKDLVHHLPFKGSYSGLQKRLRMVLDELGMEDVTIHTFRHTTASRMVQKGVDIRRVKDYLGHTDIGTTMRYAHLAPGNLESAANALD